MEYKMNKKIKELRQQATIIVGAESGFAFDREVLDEQKFAELIVRECIDILNPYKVEIGGEHFSHPAAGEIRKHFGVEE